MYVCSQRSWFRRTAVTAAALIGAASVLASPARPAGAQAYPGYSPPATSAPAQTYPGYANPAAYSWGGAGWSPGWVWYPGWGWWSPSWGWGNPGWGWAGWG